MTPELIRKIYEVFGSLVVDKKLALLGGLERMPRFVTEYLIASARTQNASISLDKIRQGIRQHAIDADQQNAIKSKLISEGQVTIISILEVEANINNQTHYARIPNLESLQFAIEPSLIAQFPELLYGGMWGSVQLKRSEDSNSYVIDKFIPYQLTKPDTEAFSNHRSKFTFEEWVDLMITSVGYTPKRLDSMRQKLLLLCRLIPLAENNVNMVELGPRNTGKSYLLRNLSSRVFLSSGARATPASLLYNLKTQRLGVIGQKKVVLFDEISATTISEPSLAAGLLDFMESGSISRSGRNYTSDCSLMFTGNVDVIENRPRIDSHLFNVFPKELSTAAFVDRIHGFIPGWEFAKISDPLLSDEPGFLSDYFGEVIVSLRRNDSFKDIVRERLSGLSADKGEVTIRDKKAIERMLTGLCRILFPDKQIGDSEFIQVAQIAIELRMRVHRQLMKMAPGEFKEKMIRFKELLSPRLLEEADSAMSADDVRANTEALIGEITILHCIDDNGGGGRGFVQCSALPGTGLSTTGMCGKVMEQSIKAAYDALVAYEDASGRGRTSLIRSKRLSVHLVNIAEYRDGPSAGLAIALAMYSALTNKPIRPGLAVTGELSLHGDVKEVGGIAEKLWAAAEFGRRIVMIPEMNRADATQVRELNTRLEIKYVKTLTEAINIAFSNGETRLL